MSRTVRGKTFFLKVVNNSFFFSLELIIFFSAKLTKEFSEHSEKQLGISCTLTADIHIVTTFVKKIDGESKTDWIQSQLDSLLSPCMITYRQKSRNGTLEELCLNQSHAAD